MCRTTDLWVWLPVWTGPAEAQNGLVWNVKVMLIILGMWTHHTQKGRFSLQCHKEVSKKLLKNLTYKSFWIFFPQFSVPGLATPSQDRWVLQRCYWFLQGSTHAQTLMDVHPAPTSWPELHQVQIFHFTLHFNSWKCKRRSVAFVAPTWWWHPSEKLSLFSWSLKCAYMLGFRLCARKMKISLPNLKQ